MVQHELSKMTQTWRLNTFYSKQFVNFQRLFQQFQPTDPISHWSPSFSSKKKVCLIQKEWLSENNQMFHPFFHQKNTRKTHTSIEWVSWDPSVWYSYLSFTINNNMKIYTVHPWKATYPQKRDYLNRKYIFQPLIFRGRVSFQGSKNQ